MAKEDKYLLNDEELEEGIEFEGNSEDDSDVEKAKRMADDNDTEVTIVDDSGNEEENLTITPNMDENVVTVSDFKNRVLSEINGELNLTEQQILDILVVNENDSHITKSDLIQEIQNILINEANMDDSIRRSLDDGTTDYSEHLDAETVKRLADEMYNDIRDNNRRKGINNMNDAQMKMLRGLQGLVPIEQQHKEELEQLAIRMVAEEFSLPLDRVDIEASIVVPGQVNKGSLKYGPEDAGDIPDEPTPQQTRTSEPTERPSGERPPRRRRDTPSEPTQQPKRRSKQELKPELTKRRLINAMIHGAARKSQYLYHLADRVNEIDPRLNGLYTDLMSGNDTVYWGMSDENIKQLGMSQDMHAGNVRVVTKNVPKPKIVAQAISFPMLLHELGKGAVELLGLHGQPKDPEEWKYVKGKVDHLANETWDIRIGPKIWEKITSIIPEDGLRHKDRILMRLFKLPAEEFNSLVSGILNDNQDSINEFMDIIEDILGAQREKEMEDSLSQYRDDYGDEEETTLEPGEDVDDMLGLGDEDEGDFDPSELSQSELDELIDQALDDGDMETVKYLSQFKK